MHEYQDQGEGDLVPGLGFGIVQILQQRKSIETVAELLTGERLHLAGVAYGRDIGDRWEHLTFEEGGTAFFLSTADIARLVDPQSGAVLYRRERL